MTTTQAVHENPIIFSGSMVQAILDGRKTQTRRIIKPQPPPEHGITVCGYSGTGWALELPNGGCSCSKVVCPFGDADEMGSPRLWVRERFLPCFGNSQPARSIDQATYVCFADGSQLFRQSGEYYPWTRPVNPASWPERAKWRPSIHMPRWASRITLEVSDVRSERLQDVSHRDCVAEGWPGSPEKRAEIEAMGDGDDACIDWYADLWNSINGDGSWDANPWVWVVSFRQITPDPLPRATPA